MYNASMPLASMADICDVIVCPSCGSRLESAAPWRCANTRCEEHTNGFLNAGGNPVFIDFDKSIVSARTFLDTARRWDRNAHRPLKRFMLKLMDSLLRNPVAERNTTRIRELLAGVSRKRLLIVGGATIGCGAQALYTDRDLQIVAFDIVPSQWTQFVADAHSIPLADSSVDAVWIQAVLEHVLEPQRVVAEIERVLSSNGIVYADTPFMQQVHMGPYDFTRFTENGHRWLFRNFECIDSGVVSGPCTQLAWSIDYAARAITRSNKIGTLLRYIALPFANFADRFCSDKHAIDGASAVYFLGRKSQTHLTPVDILTHYKGAQKMMGA